MKILLVGGLGFIGRKFVEKYFNKYKIIVYAKEDTINKSKLFFDKRVVIERGRVEDENLISVTKKYRPDVVIHLAAISGLINCNDLPEKAFNVNVYGTFNVIRACLQTGARLIFLSSREVYGKSSLYSSREIDLLQPTNTYGITKMLGEILVENAHQIHGLEYVILRLTNVYGPGYDGGLNAIVRTAIERNKIIINGRNRLLNAIYIDDVIEIIHRVLKDSRIVNQIYNVGSKDTITTAKFGRIVSRVVEGRVRLQYHPPIEMENNFRPNLKRLGKLGLLPKTSLIEGIRNTVLWYKQRLSCL